MRKKFVKILFKNESPSAKNLKQGNLKKERNFKNDTLMRLYAKRWHCSMA